MPFGTISIGLETFEPSRPGVYPKTGSALNMPTNELRFSAAPRSSKAKRVSIGVTAIEQQDFVPAGSSVSQRDETVLNISFNLPTSGAFTEAELSAMVVRAANTLTGDRIRRLILGEN